jgi:hypothetical protein
MSAIVLHSRPGASYTLVICFNGMTIPSFYLGSDVVVPTSIHMNNDANITTMWKIVSEYFAPFDVDVTTDDTLVLDSVGGTWNKTSSDRTIWGVAVGGGWQDWYGNVSSGTTIGGTQIYSGSGKHVCFAFELSSDGSLEWIGKTIAHESGHILGAGHQGAWSGGTLLDEYNHGQGSSSDSTGWAPIMGYSHERRRCTWHDGKGGSGAFQYDIEVLLTGYGPLGGSPGGTQLSLITNTVGSTSGTSSSLTNTNGIVSGLNGIIISSTDKDYWSFTTAGGPFNITCTVGGGSIVPCMDVALQLRNSSDSLILSASSNPGQNASISTTLSAGSYYLVVLPQSPPDSGTPAYGDGTADYGNQGQYTLSGTISNLQRKRGFLTGGNNSRRGIITSGKMK